MYDKAKEKFQSILTLDPDHARANEGMGVTLFKAGEFAEATEFFKKAARLHPGSMNLECNLADSYRAGGQLNEAECIYRRVLNKSPKYLDALIGMGESSKAWGDKEVETGNSEDAAEYFEKAISYFQQVQDMRYAENSSKQLTRQEHDALSYSLGYSKVRLYEARKGLNLGLLLGARKSLKSVGKTAPEYLKSQKAIRLINQKLLSYSSVINIAPIIIFILSFLLLAMAQYFTFTEPRKVYTLNREAIMSMAFKQQADTADLSKALSPFLLEQFAKPADIKKKLSATVSESVLERLDLSMIKEKEVERIKFNDVSYATITVGAIVLMIASLFLPNLTKLKIGAVEMEKNAVDTVKATTAIIKKD
jgi:Tfp pilus assembly protein PilF